MSDSILYSVREEPFVMYGLYSPKSEKKFHRLAYELAKKDAYHHERFPAGGRIAFSTDAASLELTAEVLLLPDCGVLSKIGRVAFELYHVSKNGKQRHLATLCSDSLNSVFKPGETLATPLLGNQMHDYLLYLPGYAEIEEIKLAFPKDAILSSPTVSYQYASPIVFYGGVATQGLAASRPGLSYVNRISRSLHADVLNLGFCNEIENEAEIAEYIASISSLTAFVLDCNHSVEETGDRLAARYLHFYQVVRKKHPDIPICFVSAIESTATTSYAELAQWNEHRMRIMELYLKTQSSGDRNTWFVDGFAMMQGNTEDLLSAGAVPNDLGHAKIASVVGGTLSVALRRQSREVK